MPRTWGMGEMLYSGECRQAFWGMSSNIPGSVTKHSGARPQTLQGMSSNILGNIIPENVTKHSLLLTNDAVER